MITLSFLSKAFIALLISLLVAITSGVPGSSQVGLKYSYGAQVCYGNLDDDSDVDIFDLMIFAGYFGRSDCAEGAGCIGDLNNDGDVDGSDLSLLAKEYGQIDCFPLNLPSDPADVASELDQTVATTLFDAMRFLYTGEDPIQRGMAPETIEANRAAVLRGQVFDRDDETLSGVIISILGHPEYGITLSREDGYYDLAVNGGGVLVLQYQKIGYLTVQRRTQVPWQDYTVIDDVVLTPLDTSVTTIDLNSGSVQTARGSEVTDDQGTRRATLLFAAGTEALIVMPDGSTQPADTLKIRATEYTVGENGPAAMPAELPDTTAYTYCVDLTTDEVITANAKSVKFNKPVNFYVEDLFGFPVGSAVPTGYYDRTAGEWAGSKNGRVVNILSITDGLADLDTDGDDIADDASTLDLLGFTEAELQELAALYPSLPQRLWRVPVQHFTPFDCNFPYSPPDDAEFPKRPQPKGPEPEDDPCHESDSSVIACQNQSLGEVVPIAGTAFSLVYWSDRADHPGGVDISLTGESIPSSLLAVKLVVAAGGRVFNYSFGASTNLKHRFYWDGIDAYGRQLRGAQTLKIQIGYVYPLVYYPVIADFENAWARIYGSNGVGNYIVAISADKPVTLWQTFYVVAPSYGFTLNSWEVDIHHLYDAKAQTLYKGDGDRQSAESFSARVIHSFAGNGTPGYSGDGGPAVAAQLRNPYSAAVAPDGSVYIADSGNHAIRRVNREGLITTVAGNGALCDSLYGGTTCGDGGAATDAGLNFPTGVAFGPDGSWYISDAENRRIRKVDPDGKISTFAGGVDDYSDGIPATEAGLCWVYGKVAVADDGSVFIPDCCSSDCRIRKVDPSGKIWTVLEPDYGGDNIALSPDGAIFYTSSNELYRMGTDGVITTVAGTGTPGYSGDGGPAVDAEIGSPLGVSVATDGSVYFTEQTNHLLRFVNTEGFIYTLAGTGEAGGVEDGLPSARATFCNPIDVSLGQSGEMYVTDERDHLIASVGSDFTGYSTGMFYVPDGDLLYHFDRNGRHLSTTSALSRALVYEFRYDGKGRLATILDVSGNKTSFAYDVNGNLASITAPFGQVTPIDVNDDGLITAVTYPSGSNCSFAYTSNDLMLSRTDPNGHLYSYVYDMKGQLASTTNPLDAQKTLYRTSFVSGYEVTLTTPENQIQAFRIEDLPAGGKRMTTSRGCCGEIVHETYPDGESHMAYSDGTQICIIYGPDVRWGMKAPIPVRTTIATPGGLTLTQEVEQNATFAEPDNPLSLTSYSRVTTVNGRSYQTAFDAGLKKITHTSPQGRQLIQHYDEDGVLVGYEFGGLTAKSIAYDDYGRQVAFSLGSGGNARQYTLAYDSHGEIVSVIDPLQQSTGFLYDDDGRLTEVTYPGSVSISFSYDENGNLIAITPPGRPAHLFTYTPVNDLDTYILPDAGSGSTQTRYTYDLDGRLTSIQRPGAATISMMYGANGELATATAGTEEVGFTYDDTTGKLVQIQGPSNDVIQYQYDGRLKTGEVVSGTISASVGYSYDNDLNRTVLTINGTPICDFVYDNDNLLIKAGELTVTRNTENGLVTGTMLGSVTTSYTYNPFGEVASMVAAVGGSGIYSVTFVRDKLGRIVAKTETVNAETHTYAYSYDAMGNLSSVIRDGAVSEAFSYDGNGNLIQYTNSDGQIDGSYDAQDRITTFGDAQFSHSMNGERVSKTVNGETTTYHYNGFGDLSGATLPNDTLIEYVIDGKGRRIARKSGGSIVQRFLYSGYLRPIAELDESGNPIVIFIYGTRSNVPDYMILNNTAYRIISDQVGSPRMVINSATGAIAQVMTYSAFGNLLSDTNPGFQPFGFAGGIYDPDTGLVRFGARDYDPFTARWTVKDPILFMGDITNLYRYVHNNPINRYDINGLEEDDTLFDTEEPWSKEDCDDWMMDECKKGNKKAKNKYSWCYDIVNDWNTWKKIPFFKDYEGKGFRIKRLFQEAAINASISFKTPEQKQEAANKWKKKVWDDFHEWKTNKLFWGSFAKALE